MTTTYAATSGETPAAGWVPPTWEEVVEQHSARVYRLAYRLTGNVHDAEDLTQDVFVRVFRSLHRFQPGTFEGKVEGVGLRRTVVRDVGGTVHSVSNGTIRVSSNRTRTYATATVDLDGIADRDVEAVIEILDAVGASLTEDDAFAPKLQDTPGYAGTIRLSSGGATLRLSGRVNPESRVEVEGEMRRRVAAAMAAKAIEPIRPGTYGSTTP